MTIAMFALGFVLGAFAMLIGVWLLWKADDAP